MTNQDKCCDTCNESYCNDECGFKMGNKHANVCAIHMSKKCVCEKDIYGL